jgi:hypothetical protein
MSSAGIDRPTERFSAIEKLVYFSAYSVADYTLRNNNSNHSIMYYLIIPACGKTPETEYAVARLRGFRSPKPAQVALVFRHA